MSDKEDLKNKLESVLFSSGDYVNVDELAKLCEEPDIERIKSTLVELKRELDEKNSSIMLVHESNFWKLTIRERYAQIVKKIVKQTELPKSLLETLAVVAYKAPVLQSQVIKVRTNKAYKHLDDLEQREYISREKKGRTKLIKLTQKFFDYFDVPPEKLKERFSKFQQLEAEIRTKEHGKEEKPAEQKEPEEKPEVVLVSDRGKEHKLKTYTTIEPLKDETEEERIAPLELDKIDGLEVYESEVKKEEIVKEKKKKPKKKEVAEETPEEEKPEEEAEAVEEEKKAEEVAEEVPEEEAPEEEKPEEEAEETPEEAEEEKPEEKAGAKEEEEKAEEAPEEQKPKEAPRSFEEQIKEEAKKAMPKGPPAKGRGLFSKGIPKDVQERIEKRVKEIISPEKEEEESYGDLPEIEHSEKEESEKNA